ncbi:MAG: alpha/beta hydrolase family protein [Gammaproteobacteria bacterium]
MPTRDDPVEIRTPAGSIAGTFITPRRRMPGVLFVHGWGGSQAQYLARAHSLAALGSVCLTFDLTGHAATVPQRSTVSREQNLRDVVAAYDVLVSHRAVDPERIAVVGSSYGGYLTAILSSMRAIRWMALRAPALYVDTGWEVPKVRLSEEQGLAAYRRSFVPADENRALSDCSNYQGDVLIAESEFDDRIPHPVIASYVESFSRARSMTWRTIPGADHGLTEESSQQAWSALLINWMTEMMFIPAGKETPKPQASTRASEETPEAPPGPG